MRQNAPKIQTSPRLEGAAAPRSIASATAFAVSAPPPHAHDAPASPRSVSLTRWVTRARSRAPSASARSASAVSSATSAIEGHVAARTTETIACAAKSAAVTGLSSDLLVASVRRSASCVDAQSAEARRTASHAARISSGKSAIDAEEDDDARVVVVVVVARRRRRNRRDVVDGDAVQTRGDATEDAMSRAGSDGAGAARRREN